MGIPQPKAQAQGTGGALRLGPLPIGVLTTWRLVVSPTTGRPTLIAEARIRRAYLVAPPTLLTALVIPDRAPALIGRPAPPVPHPLRISGKVARLTAQAVTLAECSIERAEES